MRKLAAVILAAFFFTGCATSNKRDGGFLSRHSGSKKVARGINKPAKGVSSLAAKGANAIGTRHALPGPDEALFRLALVSLKPSAERPVSAQGLRLLKRLKMEYPASPWTVHAARLMELVKVAEDLRQQNGALKAANQSLTKEIDELNENIEQLKHLDLELEQNARPATGR